MDGNFAPRTDLLLASDIEEIAANLGDEALGFGGKRIVLTGAGGFLGRYYTAVLAHLNETVLEKPCEVVALDNLITSNGDRAGGVPGGKGIRFVRHDVIRPYEIDHKVDFILHAAGIASPFYYRAYPLETLEVAITGTRRLLELARRDDARMMFMSSSEIYGDPDPAHVPTPESYRGNVACQGPRACYDEGKRAAEALFMDYHRMNRINIRIVRIFNTYGPYMHPFDGRVVSNFIRQALRGEDITIFGDGSQTRSFCYRDDLIEGMMRMMAGLMAIPAILLAIGLVSLWGGGLLTVMIAIAIPEVPRVVRLVRAIVLGVREEPYVEAAISLGTPLPLLLIRHGRTAWNAAGRMQGRADIGLSTAGRAEVARWRLPPGWDGARWLVSPVRRAREAAAPLGAPAARGGPRPVRRRRSARVQRAVPVPSPTHPTAGAGPRHASGRAEKDQRWRDRRSASGSRPTTMRWSTPRPARSWTRSRVPAHASPVRCRCPRRSTASA